MRYRLKQLPQGNEAAIEMGVNRNEILNETPTIDE